MSVGTIQAAEWTFTTGSYASLSTDTAVFESSTIGYTWDGIAFNTVHAYINNVNFRQAMAYLMDYGTLQSTLGAAVSATPQVLPVVGYGFMLGHEPAGYTYSLTAAANSLIAAGLCGVNVGAPTTCLTTGQGAQATLTTVWHGVATGTTGTATAASPVFSPLFYYRMDNLRTTLALQLQGAAAEIGLTFVMDQITGTEAGSLVYGESEAAGCTAGGVPSGCTLANGTADTWDMYTYGWITSDNYEAQAEFWNNAFLGSSVDFGNFYNANMTTYSNMVLSALQIGVAETGAIGIAQIEMIQLPYLNGFFQNTLFADYIAGWTGYANIPTTGPSTMGGIYYTLLNVHPTNVLTGGNLIYALYSAPTYMNPLYNTNWVWQADLWSEFYDTALATPPAQFTTVNAFLNYMTTSYSTTAYSGKVPGGSFVYQNFVTSAASSKKCVAAGAMCLAGNYITNGEAITFTFAKNITFSDGVPFTAKDYQYSLYIWDLATKTTSQADELTPDTGLMPTNQGLIASHITVTSKVDSITVYLGSNSLWNLADLIVPIMPQHILQYFNPDHLATAAGTFETAGTYPSSPTTNYFTQSSAKNKTSGLGAITVPKAPVWMTYEPNMEIGSGPFTLTAYSIAEGTGIMTANPNYFRAAWYADINATTNTISPGASWTHTYTIQMFINNPTSSTYCTVAAGQQGYCPITGKILGESTVKTSGVVTLEYCSTAPVGQFGPTNCSPVDNLKGKLATYSLVQQVTCSITPKAGKTCPKGDITAYSDNYQLTVSSASSKTMAALSPGYYEAILSTTFKFQGLTRTWYQATGFDLS